MLVLVSPLQRGQSGVGKAPRFDLRPDGGYPLRSCL